MRSSLKIIESMDVFRTNRWAAAPGVSVTVLLLAVLLAVNAVAVWGILSARESARGAALNDLELQTTAHARAFEAVLATLRGDLIFLAQSPPVAKSLPALDSDDPMVRRWGRLDLEGTLLLFMQAHPAVERLVVRDGAGRPLVAAGRRQGAPVLLPREGAELPAEESAAYLPGRWPIAPAEEGGAALTAAIDVSDLLAAAAPGLEGRLALERRPAAGPSDTANPADPADDGGSPSAFRVAVPVADARWEPPIALAVGAPREREPARRLGRAPGRPLPRDCAAEPGGHHPHPAARPPRLPPGAADGAARGRAAASRRGCASSSTSSCTASGWRASAAWRPAWRTRSTTRSRGCRTTSRILDRGPDGRRGRRRPGAGGAGARGAGARRRHHPPGARLRRSGAGAQGVARPGGRARPHRRLRARQPGVPQGRAAPRDGRAAGGRGQRDHPRAALPQPDPERLPGAARRRRDRGGGPARRRARGRRGRRPRPRPPPPKSSPTSSSRSTPRKGSTGLGLAVCHGIVADHRGEIRAANRAGGGARFEVVLPLAADAAPAPAGEPAPAEGRPAPVPALTLGLDARRGTVA